MGICASSDDNNLSLTLEPGMTAKEARARSVATTKQLEFEYHIDTGEYRFVLMGAPRSGKSTWRRYMHMLMTPPLPPRSYDPWGERMTDKESKKRDKADLIRYNETKRHDEHKFTWTQYATLSRPLIRRYVISLVKAIWDALKLHGRSMSVINYMSSNGSGAGDAKEMVDISVAIIQLRDDGEHVRPEVANAIQLMWSSTSMINDSYGSWNVRQWIDQYIHDNHSRAMIYPFNDSINHFMQRFATIASSDYIASDMDVILSPLQYDDPPSRHISVSELSQLVDESLPVALIRIIALYVNDNDPLRQPVTEAIGSFKSWDFRWIDVHQEKCSRRKWIHCFDMVEGILWFSSLMDYATPDPEGEYVSKLGRHISEFRALLSSYHFDRHSIFLLLTRRDLFEKVMTTKQGQDDMIHYWPDYKPDASDKSAGAAGYLLDLFAADDGAAAPPRLPTASREDVFRPRNRDRTIFRWCTSLVDQTEVERTFDNMTDIVMRSSLENVG